MKMDVTLSLPPVFRTRQRPKSAKTRAQTSSSSGSGPSRPRTSGRGRGLGLGQGMAALAGGLGADPSAFGAPSGAGRGPTTFTTATKPARKTSSTSTLAVYPSTPIGPSSTPALPTTSDFPTPDSESVKVNIIRRVNTQKGSVRFQDPSASTPALAQYPDPAEPERLELGDELPSYLETTPEATPTATPTPSAAAAASRRHSTTFIDHTSRRTSSTPPSLAINQLRIAFQETPPMLRSLEDGWRARRSRTLVDVSSTSMDKPLKSTKSLLRRAKTPDQKIDPYLLEQAELARRRMPESHRSASGTQYSPQSKADKSAKHLGRHSMIVDPNALAQPMQLPLTPPTSPPPLPTMPAVTADGPAYAAIQAQAEAALAHASVPHSPHPYAHPQPPSYPPPQVPESVNTHGTGDTAPPSPTLLAAILKPISTSCLPPTKHAVPLHKKSAAKITVHSASHPVSLTLGFQGTTVRVNRAGDEIAISSGPEDQRTRTILRLADAGDWGEEECQYWLRLLSLVDEYKRRTPKLKVYTEMGDLTISCSDQPDVILVYSIEASFLHLDNSEIVPDSMTKVRIRYSNPREFEIETSSKTKDGGRLKTRRIGPLTKNSSTHTEGDFELFWQATLLGIAIGADWNDVEKEAVKRLYSVRKEWVRSVRIEDEDEDE